MESTAQCVCAHAVLECEYLCAYEKAHTSVNVSIMEVCAHMCAYTFVCEMHVSVFVLCICMLCEHPWGSAVLEKPLLLTQVPFCYLVSVPSLFLSLNHVTISTQGKVITMAHPGMLVLGSEL